MIVIVWLVTGGLLGWMSGIVSRTATPRAASMNVLAGIAGALLGGWLLAPWFGVVIVHENDVTLASVGTALLGAAIALGVSSIVRRGVVR